MEIKLNSLTLENFKGIRNFSFDMNGNGNGAIIRGDNGTGKSTLMDAFLWLLFNKDSQGKADFAIKTLDDTGQEMHNLEHSVEGKFEVDGTPIVLKKVFKEVYTKKRGASQSIHTGHTTDHYIDGVPDITKTQWDKKISEIIDEDTFKLLTSPAYFNSLHWQRRREIIIQVCGDVSNEDVLNATFPAITDKASYGALANILNQRTLDEHKKVVAAQKKKINDRLKEIPARIDELNKSIADTSGYDPIEIEARIKELETEIQALKDDKSFAALRTDKVELQAQLEEARSVKKKAERGATKEADKEVEDLEDKIGSAKRTLQKTCDEIGDINDNIERNNKRMNNLRQEYGEVSAQEFKKGKESLCPNCNYNLSEKETQAALKRFNTQQANRREDINSRGKNLKALNEDATIVLEKLLKKKTGWQKEIKGIESELKVAEIDVTEAYDGAGVREAQEIDRLETEISNITEKIKDNPPPDTTDLETELKAERARLAEIDASKKTRGRIDELTKEEKSLAAEYEGLEKQTHLMEKFIVTKVGLLEDKINSRFELARFKLFNILVNGGVEECCETLYEGVPYSSGLNDGAQTLVGCDIVSTLQGHYGVKAPLWLDHSESVNYPINMECQAFFLEVSKDKSLKVEYTS